MLYGLSRHSPLWLVGLALAVAVLAVCHHAEPEIPPGVAPEVTATLTRPAERTPTRTPSVALAPTPETFPVATTETAPTPTAVALSSQSATRASTQDEQCSSVFCSSSFWSVASAQDVLDELHRGTDLGEVNEDGMAPLHLAAGYSSREVVKLLLDHGADIDARVRSHDDNRDATPLHMAIVDNKDPEVITELLEWGADIDVQNDLGMTPLQMVHFAGPEVVALLQGSHPADGCSSALCSDAFWHGASLQDVIEELGRGASLSAINDNGMSPLHLAAQYSRPEIVELLLDHGADIDARVNLPEDAFQDSNRSTPLHLAVQHNADPGVTEALLERGADVHIQNANWVTPLQLASDAHPDVLALLLERYPDLNKSEMLRTAAIFDNIAVANVLLEKGADVNYRWADHPLATPLHCAIVYAGHEMPRLLLEHGADPLVKNNLGMTPLHFAADGGGEYPTGSVELMAVLLEYGADVNAVAHADGATPLHYAVHFKEPDAVTLLLEHGAAVNVRNAQGDTALVRSVSNGDAVAVLLEWGADVNIAGANGWTPLHRTVVHGSWNVTNTLTLLLQYGAEIEARDFSGRTPLHLAARWYKAEATATLLEHGANTEALDSDGSTPCQIADQVDVTGVEANEQLDRVRRLLGCQ